MNIKQPILDLNYLQSLINSLHYKPYHYKSNGPATGILTKSQAIELCKRNGWIQILYHRLKHMDSHIVIFVDNPIPFTTDMFKKDWVLETHEPSKAITVEAVFNLVFSNVIIIESKEHFVNFINKV